MIASPLVRGSSVLVALSLAGASASAQLHAELRDTFSQAGSVYGDVWGDGTHVYLGHFFQNRIDILNFANPDNVTLSGTFTVTAPDDLASAQDVKVGDGLLFIALESADPNGTLIVDVRNPASPQLRTRIDSEPGNFEQIHNLFYDEGWLYQVNSSDNTIAILDLRTYDPDAAPAAITGWTYRIDNVGSIFVHDITVQNGRLFAAAWDGLYVFDVSNLGVQAPQFMGSARGINCHSVWATDDGAYLVTGEEREGGALRLYEMIDNGSTVQLIQRDSYAAPRAAAYTVHNPLIVGDRVYASFYQEGGVVLEIDRTTHTWEVVADYDTSSAGTSGFAGAWGVYPFLGEDRVLVSDIENGFFSLDFSSLTIAWPSAAPTLVAPSTPTPITVQISAAGNAVLNTGSPTLHWSVEGGAAVTAPMANVGGGQWSANLPGVPCETQVEYWVTAADTSGDVYTDPETPGRRHVLHAASGLTTVFSDPFDANLGWTTSNGSATAGFWTRGVPFHTAGQPGSGDPEGSASCYFTGQGTNGGSDGEADVDGGTLVLTSPNMDFSAGDGLISYSRWFYNDDQDGDSLTVQISGNGGGSWTTVETVTDKAGGWLERTIRVSDHVAPSATVRLRFQVADEPNNSVTEAAIDEVVASTFDCAGGPAASHVVRNGNGSNPLGYAVVTEPVIGQDWQLLVDIATPGHLASVVTMSLGSPISGPNLAGFLNGQILMTGPLLPADVAVGSHAIPIPFDLSLVGLTLPSQGATFAPGGLFLNNAIDAIFGF